MGIDKLAIIAWLVSLDDRDPRLEAIERIRLPKPSIGGVTSGRAMTISEAAAKAGMSRMTLYRAIKAKALRASIPIPDGNQRILEVDLESWLLGDR